jgi:hypothetical protein
LAFRPERIAGFGAFVLACSCLAQTTVPAIVPDTSPATSPATAPATEDAGPVEADDLAPMRAPLLRESSHLVEARGTLKRDPTTNWWKLQLDPQDVGFAVFDDGRNIPPYELILLPTTTLSEMQRVFESIEDSRHQAMFEVNGQVLVYRGRNYAIINHAGRIVQEQSEPRPATATTAPATQAAAAESQGGSNATQPADDSIDDIKSGLERSLQSVPEHINAANSSADDSRNSAPSKLGFTVDSAPAHGTERALREGTAVQSRRGKISRDSAGAWMFIFDADATGISAPTNESLSEAEGETGSATASPGGADPPMRLLPCLLLEKIEDYARRNPGTAPVLITGEVYLYQGRNYLLPTVFRIPQERTKISP